MSNLENESLQKQSHQQKIVLLPRARLDLSDDSLKFLSLSTAETKQLQSLLDKSPLEERLKLHYSKENLSLQTITSTRISLVKNAQDLYQKLQYDCEPLPNMIVFVSKNAGILAELMLPKKVIAQAKLFSVGKSCQVFFSEQGVDVASASEESAKGLLSLPDFSDIKGKNILICKGSKGLNDLQEQCESRGAKVKVIDFYQRNGVEKVDFPKNKQVSEIYGVSVFALKHLLQGVSYNESEKLLNTPLLAMSERIATAASKMGFANIKVKVI